MVIGFVMGTVAGAIIAFFFGTSQSSRNKDSALLGRQP
jgi:ABC-type nitrate/sulfonate/bicarbonate transport system permease component